MNTRTSESSVGGAWQRATLSLFSVFVLGGCHDNPLPTGVPAPYTAPSAGSQVCELSADCPAGTYCDLGECIQTCNRVIDPCTGEMTCTPRGRCQEQAHDVEPAPPTTAPPSVSANVQSIDIDEVTNEALVMLTSSPTTEAVRWRATTDVPWLQPSVGRGELNGAAMLMFNVNHSLVAASGTESGSIHIATSSGAIDIPVSIRTGVSGVYDGRIIYKAPIGLGSASIRLEVKATGNSVEARLVPEFSPLFPTANGIDAIGSGQYVGNVLTATISQRFTPADLGANSFTLSDVGRTLALQIEISPEGGLTGTFTDTWTGMLPESIVLTGDLIVNRLPNEVPSAFVSGVPPTLPGNPSPTAPAIAAICGLGSTCTAASTTPQLIACTTTMLTSGYGLENPSVGLNIVTTGAGTTGYATMAAACTADVAAPAGATAATQATCIRPSNMECATALAAQAIANANDAGQGVGVLDDVVANRASSAVLVLNEALVQSYQAPYKSPSANTTTIEATSLDALATGRNLVTAQLKKIFDPYTMGRLRVPQPTGTTFTGVQAVGQLLAQDLLASSESLTIRTRRAAASGTGTSALREEAARETVRLLLAVAELGLVANRQGLNVNDQLTLFVGGVTTLSERFSELRPGADPLGFPDGYVYFDDPRTSGASLDWNYLNIRQNAQSALQDAITSGNDAAAASRDYDDRTDQIQTQLTALGVEIDQEVQQACGLTGLADLLPDYSNCGTVPGSESSEIGVAIADVNEANESLRLSWTRVFGALESIEVEEARWGTESGALRGQLEFYDAQNHKIDRASRRARRARGISRWVHAAAGLVSSITKIAKGDFGAIADLATTATDAAAGEVEEAQQVAIREANEAKEMKNLETGLTTTEANHVARVRELEIQSAQLTAEAAVSSARAESAVRRASSVLNRLRSGITRHQRLVASASGSLNNDPRFRIIRDDAVTRAIQLREVALRHAYLVATAFQYETNVPWPAVLQQLVPARKATTVQTFVNTCMNVAQTLLTGAFGSTTERATDISLREDVFGIHGDVLDHITRQRLSPAMQFQRILMDSANVTTVGNIGLRFSTTIVDGNPVFSSGLCNDLITDIQVWLVGDRLGDNQAEIRLYHGGANTLRSCRSTPATGDIINAYSLEPRVAQLQAGINAAPSSAADTQFFGRSVAATDWRIELRPNDSQNQDIDVSGIEDVIIRLRHHAHTAGATPSAATYSHPICSGL